MADTYDLSSLGHALTDDQETTTDSDSESDTEYEETDIASISSIEMPSADVPQKDSRIDSITSDIAQFTGILQINFLKKLDESPGWEDSLSHSELLDQYKRLKDLYDAEIKYLSNKEDALQLKNDEIETLLMDNKDLVLQLEERSKENKELSKTIKTLEKTIKPYESSDLAFWKKRFHQSQAEYDIIEDLNRELKETNIKLTESNCKLQDQLLHPETVRPVRSRQGSRQDRGSLNNCKTAAKDSLSDEQHSCK